MSAASIAVGPAESELRLDRWFKRHYPDLPHGRLEKLLRTGQIRVDGGRAKASQRLQPGQIVRVPPLDPAPAPTRPLQRRIVGVEAAETDLLRRVTHRDDDVLIIDKPAGLAVQGGSGTDLHLDALLDALRFGAPERPRLVHRLDKDTSGVLVLARNARAASWLAEAFRNKDARKVYWAIVVGLPKLSAGRIDLPLSKQGSNQGERVRPDEEGRRAVTFYRVVEHAGRRASWLALMPETGRTHQLRVHCAEMGTPILGDGKYGGSAAFLPGVDLAKRLHLHARSIELPRPGGGILSAKAPLPKHMAATWRFFGFDLAPSEEPLEQDRVSFFQADP